MKINTEGKIVMILIVKNMGNDSGGYLGEMLSLWGGNFWEEVYVSEWSGRSCEVSIVSPGVDVDVSLVKDKLGEGEHVILITPSRGLLAGLGIDYRVDYGDDGGVGYMRLAEPLLGSFSHYSLPILGRRVLPVGKHYSGDFSISLPADAKVWSYMFEQGTHFTDRPAVWSVGVGRGKLTVFNYDLVECMRNLRQGQPRYAGWRADFDDICRPAYLFGPDWIGQFQSEHLPVVDFHPILLLRLIEESVDFPMVRFWQLPGNSRSVILVSGDEDGALAEEDKTTCAFMDSVDANMTTYIQMQATRTECGDLQVMMDNGHSFSVHPYPMEKGNSGWSPSGDVLAEIEECVKDFQRRYNLPVRSIRNHRGYWAGYVDIPRLWEKLGVAMDTNYAGCFFSRDFSGYYRFPAASLPLRFMDEKFGRIDVLQQPVVSSDDAEFDSGKGESKSKNWSAEMFEVYGESLIRNNLEPLGLPFAFVFHPGNFCGFAGEAEKRFLRKVKSLGADLISDYDWLDFWEARSSWRVMGVQKIGDGYVYHLSGKASEQPISLSLPGEQIKKVEIDGREMEGCQITHFGQKRILIPLPAGAEQIELNVFF